MNDHTSNSQLKVDGKMSEKGADRVGFLQAIALLILVCGIVAIGLVLALKQSKLMNTSQNRPNKRSVSYFCAPKGAFFMLEIQRSACLVKI